MQSTAQSNDDLAENASHRPLFWLHIRKAAGTSLRAALNPYYVSIKKRVPLRFEDIPQEQWNDNLNNYRVDLGDYQARRMVYAKQVLYSAEDFAAMHKFAVVRHPVDRAISCWKYLTNHGINLNPVSSMRYLSFAYFLDSLPDFWAREPQSHLATHTTPMWLDLSDEAQKTLLVDQIIPLEKLDDGIEEMCAAIGVPPISVGRKNVTKARETMKPKQVSPKIRARIETLYSDDFENFYPDA